jgi:hypothetical protein
MKNADELIELFSAACEDNKKLFIPSQSDRNIAQRLLDHYRKFFSEEILIKTMIFFVKNSPDPIQISSFALESSKIRDRVVEEQKDADDINLLMQETRIRMERLNESRNRPN